VEAGNWADLVLWDAPSLDDLAFGSVVAKPELVIVGGRIVLCHTSMVERVNGLADLRPSAVDSDFHCAFEVPRCFT
jgi:imidazolonepropionase-like amidohydrolase